MLPHLQLVAAQRAELFQQRQRPRLPAQVELPARPAFDQHGSNTGQTRVKHGSSAELLHRRQRPRLPAQVELPARPACEPCLNRA